MESINCKNKARNKHLRKVERFYPVIHKSSKHNHLLIDMNDNENGSKKEDYLAIYDKASRKNYILRLLAVA
ncbi:MAG: hypothetical protein HYR97_07570 [Candidatus Melainabacteria bacterium]|nr:hypothetical protein [Candidatus Melainabacteria bacterium]MBI3308610.1 hypothetical protein [Candidatus Melainabacteria bacterium]